MSTTLISNKDYQLTRYWGGEKRGVMYQITQNQREPFEYFFVELSKKDIKHILHAIEKGEQEMTDECPFKYKQHYLESCYDKEFDEYHSITSEETYFACKLMGHHYRTHKDQTENECIGEEQCPIMKVNK